MLPPLLVSRSDRSNSPEYDAVTRSHCSWSGHHRLHARAREPAAGLGEAPEQVQRGKPPPTEVRDNTTREADASRRGADEYAAGVLIRLEGECIKALTSIKRGIDMLDERHRPPRPIPDEGEGQDALPIEIEHEPLGSAARL